jgi:hypothetical protein
MQFTQFHPISLKPLLIISTHLYLVLPSGLFSSGFHTKPRIISILALMFHKLRPVHSSYHIIEAVSGEQYKSELVLVDARSKALVFGRSLAGIVCSNLAGGMEFCLL